MSGPELQNGPPVQRDAPEEEGIRSGCARSFAGRRLAALCGALILATTMHAPSASAGDGITIHVTPSGCTRSERANHYSFDPSGTSQALTSPVTVYFLNVSADCGAQVTLNGRTIYIFAGTASASAPLDHAGYFPYAPAGAPSGTFGGEIHVVDAPKPSPSPAPAPKPAPQPAPNPATTPRPAAVAPQQTVRPAPTLATRSVTPSQSASPSLSPTSLTPTSQEPSSSATAAPSVAFVAAAAEQSAGVSPLAAVGIGLGAGVLMLGGGSLIMARRRRARDD